MSALSGVVSRFVTERVKHEKEQRVVNEDVNDYHYANHADSVALVDEVRDLVISLSSLDQFSTDWEVIANQLRTVRSTVLFALPRFGDSDEQTESEPDYSEDSLANYGISESVDLIEQSIKSGPMKMKDGSTVAVSDKDAETLNKLISKSSYKKNFIRSVVRSADDYNSVLRFAKELMEETDPDSENEDDGEDDTLVLGAPALDKPKGDGKE